MLDVYKNDPHLILINLIDINVNYKENYENYKYKIKQTIVRFKTACLR